MTAERLWSTHVRRELDQLGEAFPGWRFRFDSLDGMPVSGSVSLSAEDPATLARLIRAQRMQVLVVP